MEQSQLPLIKIKPNYYHLLYFINNEKYTKIMDGVIKKGKHF